MSPLAQALGAALPPGFSLRDRVDADLPYLCALYASTREEELRPVAWSDEQKQSFLADQFTKQHAHYLEHYPGALWLVIEHGQAAIGRMYLWPCASEIRLMDIALDAAHRNGGIGTRLMNGLTAFADAAGLFVSLHVEPFNPAMRLYRRLGFEDIETRGYYQYMKRPVPGAPIQLNTSS